MDGISVIRAFGVEGFYSDKNICLIESGQRVEWGLHILNRWLGVRAELLGAFISFSVATVCVFASSSLGSGYVGLLITQSMVLATSLTWLIRTLIDTENLLTSVERIILFISDIILEGRNIDRNHAPNNDPAFNASLDWPSRGKIEFDNFSLRYRPNLPRVLNNLSFVINPMEKIGICGRTGAGKSSILLSLFRIIEADEGRILIDDVDISKFGLSYLRSRLSVIPQMPLLYPGSIRYNLDPFSEFSDEKIWDALDKVKLKALVTTYPNQLDSTVVGNGDNFSVGEKQLISIARVILREPKILILDEATASVDSNTDQLIQTMIRTEFSKCTILTIAHRLSSIVDSDKILVLSEGRIVEYDTPSVLMGNPDSHFHKLLNSTLETVTE